MRWTSLCLAATLLASGACSGTVGDDLSSAELARYDTVAFRISGMT